MAGNLTDRKGVQEPATSSPEVEFALVLARTIEAIQTDPEQLRGAVYELARQKLREQLSDEDASEISHMTAALEVAIRGVEEHSRKDAARQSLSFNPNSAARAISDQSHTEQVAVIAPRVSEDSGLAGVGGRPRSAEWIAGPHEKSPSRRMGLGAPLRFTLVLAVVLLAVGLVALERSGSLKRLWKSSPLEVASQTPVEVNRKPAPVQQPEPPKPALLLPTAYGVYAVDGDKLYDLDALQARAPDIRVAISTAILTPSRTTLPDGKIKFIVFRRESGNRAADQVDVRVVAKIEQDTKFDTSGKPVTSGAEESWVIRNISFPYRSSPIKDNPEMYEVQSKDPDTGLTPGRYVLVIKDAAYDFTVAGQPTDSRACMGRVAAANGVFYSACQKP